MVVSCNIQLDMPEGSKIITGTTLKGIVKYELDKEIAYKTISVALVGKGNCTWQHRPMINNKPADQVVTYYGSETYPIGKIYLLQKNKNDKAPVEVGTYKHPFEFNISEFIPPSFSSSLGEIKYTLAIKFKKFGFFSFNKEFNYNIQIYPAVPITIPSDPITINFDISLNKLFTDQKRQINVKVTVDKVYLIPGHATNISYIVTNDSDVKPNVKTELIQISTYRDAQYNTKIVEKVVDESTVRTPNILENSVANMHNTLTVFTERYTTRNSNIVAREFKLKFTLKLPLPHLNASMEVPVYIGERKEVPVAIAEVAEMARHEPIREAPPTYWEAIYEDKS